MASSSVAFSANCRRDYVTKMKIAYQTDIGQQRHQNQDRVATYVDSTGRQLMIVADGIGGNRSGDVAAEFTVDHLGRRFEVASPTAPLEAIRWFAREVQLINDEILTKSKSNPKYQKMGTTLVAAISFGNELVVANIGDSRGYLLHQNEFSQVTVDHSLVNELVKNGDITPEEAQCYPQSNIITRAIGVSKDAQIEVNRFKITTGDQLLLCSDGLSKMISDDEMAKILQQDVPMTEKCHQLIAMANQAGGPDNITVLIGLNDQEG